MPIAKGLNEPSGVAFRNGSLYVGEISRIVQVRRHRVEAASRRASRWS